MMPSMSRPEISLFSSFLRCAENYFEFGSGGSTCLAVQHVRRSVTSLDSSKQWLDQVAEHCVSVNAAIRPTLILADIGPTRDWGFPANDSHRDRWPSYHAGHWDSSAAVDADLYLVDGRFRVACFMQTLLHCKQDSLIMIHDFAARVQYHVVNEVAREIARSEDLSVFRPLGDGTKPRVREILVSHEYVTD